MQKIIPHLWFDTQAREAVTFYTGLFENSGIDHITTLHNTPSGDAEIVDFHLAGFHISSISAGPFFQINPSFSFMVSCPTTNEVNRLYQSLSLGGTDLMPLDTYPFSPRYAWVQDRYGLSWQLMQTTSDLTSALTSDSTSEQPIRIRPCLLFADASCGKAMDAMNNYSSIFPDSNIGYVNYYSEGEVSDVRAKINYSEVTLYGTDFVFMDHGMGGDFRFNEATSLIVNCRHQGELDAYWEQLSFNPESEQCGWLKDAFGLSWQITPEQLTPIMSSSSEEELNRITEAFLPMKKLDLHRIVAARKGFPIPEPIVVETLINAPVEKVWEHWNSVTWMEAKDGSFGFEFSGVYDFVDDNNYIEYTLVDGRKVFIRFIAQDNKTKIIESFDGESDNPREMQQARWHAILSNFKKYCEAT